MFTFASNRASTPVSRLSPKPSIQAPLLPNPRGPSPSHELTSPTRQTMADVSIADVVSFLESIDEGTTASVEEPPEKRLRPTPPPTPPPPGASFQPTPLAQPTLAPPPAAAVGRRWLVNWPLAGPAGLWPLALPLRAAAVAALCCRRLTRLISGFIVRTPCSLVDSIE